jgi:phage shock protein PspC (stress-responsive transcriptional regulator)
MNLKDLKRDHEDFVIGGVCGGIAKVTNQPSWVWRIGTIAVCIFFPLAGLAYLAAWVVLPCSKPCQGKEA